MRLMSCALSSKESCKMCQSRMTFCLWQEYSHRNQRCVTAKWTIEASQGNNTGRMCLLSSVTLQSTYRRPTTVLLASLGLPYITMSTRFARRTTPSWDRRDEQEQVDAPIFLQVFSNPAIYRGILELYKNFTRKLLHAQTAQRIQE